MGFFGSHTVEAKRRISEAVRFRATQQIALIDKSKLFIVCKICGEKKYFTISEKWKVKKQLFCSKKCQLSWVRKLPHKKRGKYSDKIREAMRVGWEKKSGKYKHISKDWLLEYYLNKKLGTPECGKLANCSCATIYRRLKKFGIPVRNHSESQKGLHIGDKSPRWKGGRKIKKCCVCGNNTNPRPKYNDGRKVVCSKFCKAKLMSLINGGEKCHLWQGGSKKRFRGNNFIYKNWRRSVFIRDEFTCQKCNQKNIYIQAHHIMPYAKFPELRFDINNGATLCKNCHKEEHRSLVCQ